MSDQQRMQLPTRTVTDSESVLCFVSLSKEELPANSPFPLSSHIFARSVRSIDHGGQRQQEKEKKLGRSR